MANKSKFISTQQTLSYSFQTSTFASFWNKWTSKIHQSKKKKPRPNQSLTGVFPTTEAPPANIREQQLVLQIGTHWTRTSEGDHFPPHPGQPSSQQGVYSFWKITTSINLHNQEEKLPELNAPAILHRLSGSEEHFLSLQHSYSKFGVFRTILPATTNNINRTEKFQAKQSYNTEFNNNNSKSSWWRE